jgi:hypothetical protein
MNLLIGGPVSCRGWILPKWLEHTEAAARVAGIEPKYLIAADSNDDCWPALESVNNRLTRAYLNDPRDEDVRDWLVPRLERMVVLRNQVLARVRKLRPDVFLSLDSDILLHPDSIKNLLETLQDYDVVGGYAYLGPGTHLPTWANLVEGELERDELVGYVGDVGVVMAIKAMKPTAYAIDYRYHQKGEDPGICEAWVDAGLRIGLDSRVVNKHVMERWQLPLVDERCGY